MKVPPTCAHAEPSGPGYFGFFRLSVDSPHRKGPRRLGLGFEMAALRAVFAVFGAPPGLDGQKRAQLHLIGIKIPPVHTMGGEEGR